MYKNMPEPLAINSQTTLILGFPLLPSSFRVAKSCLTHPLNPKYLRELRIVKEFISFHHRTWLLSFDQFSGQPPCYLPHWFHLRKPELYRAACVLMHWVKCVRNTCLCIRATSAFLTRLYSHPLLLRWTFLCIFYFPFQMCPLLWASPSWWETRETVISTQWPNHWPTHLDNEWYSGRFYFLIISYELDILIRLKFALF